MPALTLQLRLDPVLATPLMDVEARRASCLFVWEQAIVDFHGRVFDREDSREDSIIEAFFDAIFS